MPSMRQLREKSRVRRLRRRDRSLSLFSGTELFLAGLFLSLSFTLNPSLAAKAIQGGLFLACCFLSGGRVAPLAIFLVSTSVVALNLLAPFGRVLAVWGPLRVTEGALFSGLDKALTLEGLILLSHATVRSDLRLPGRFGSLIADAFRYLEVILERKREIDPKHLVESLDALLLSISSAPLPASDCGKKKRRPIGTAILLLLAALCCLPLLLAI